MHLNHRRSRFSKVCAIMNLPKPVTKKSFNKIQKKIAENIHHNSKKFKEKLFQKVENILTNEDGEKYKNVVIGADGTWMKRVTN